MDYDKLQNEALIRGDHKEFKRLVLLEKGIIERGSDPNDLICESSNKDIIDIMLQFPRFSVILLK